ncbi:MAG: hypothetical protein JNK05_35435 [Myxococcales bacterium]|nr:hypothetical protein [Myxococcales bacterium]
MQSKPPHSRAPLPVRLARVLPAIFALNVACLSPSTHVVVVVDTDAPASRITQLRVKLLDPTSREQLREQVVFPREGVAAVLPLPSSFSVVPAGRLTRDGSAEVRIELTTTLANGAPVVLTRNVRFNFIANRRAIARVYMPVACTNVATGCPSGSIACTLSTLCESRGQTCGDEASCVVPDVPVTPFDTDVERAPDVPSPRDGAMDAPAPTDAGTDASIDAAPSDAQPSDAQPDSTPGCVGGCAPRPNANGVCDAGGVCRYTCAMGFADCDSNPANGCEVSLASNAHCGRCNNACSGATPLCNAMTGMCTSACTGGQTLCGMACVDTQTNATHCGMCGNNCRADQRCAAGSCQCAAGTECGGRCTDTSTDRSNCGACGRACRADQTCAAGVCRCTTGTDCGGMCRDTSSDPSNCGACGMTCMFNRAASSCAMGVCRLGACNSGWGNCDGNMTNGCEQDLSSSAHCGTCGNACTGATPVCSGGMCSSGCLAGQTRCGMTCANLNTDTSHCGACGRACTPGPNQTAICATGMCQYACTTSSRGDCNGMTADGCEADLNTSTVNCGRCGTSCPARANATAVCSLGVCSFTCDAGFADCDGNAMNGCETNTNTSLVNCGGCGRVCAGVAGATATCTGGFCGFTCNAGLENCDGNPTNGCETNTTNNPMHCSGCGLICASRPNATATCTGSTCGFACNSTFRNCNGLLNDGCEADTASDAANCGMCGRACPVGGTCTSGVCACPSGFTNCGGRCVNLNIDSGNCGACGAACVVGAGCCGRMCVTGIGQECAFNCMTRGIRECGPLETGEGICRFTGPAYSPPSAATGIQCESSGAWGLCGGVGMCNFL